MSHNIDYEDLMFECVRDQTKRRRAWKAERDSKFSEECLEDGMIEKKLENRREMAEHCEKDVEP